MMLAWCVLLAVVLYGMRAFDVEGSVSGAALTYIIWYTQGLQWVWLLSFFVLSGVIATKIGRRWRKKTHKERGVKNVFANGFVALIAAVRGDFGAYLGSLAAVSADTIASELGTLSPQWPKMITNWRLVPTGTNGAISPMGEAVSIFISLLLGVAAFAWGFGGPELLGVSLISGFVGTNVDSLLGATLERKGLLDNHSVNFIASVTGAIVGAILL